MEKGVAESSNWRQCSAPQASGLCPRWGPPHHPPQWPLGHPSRNAVPSQDRLWANRGPAEWQKNQQNSGCPSSLLPSPLLSPGIVKACPWVTRCSVQASSVLGDLTDLSWGILPSKRAHLHFWWARHITQPNHSCLQRRSACLSQCFPKILIVL